MCTQKPSHIWDAAKNWFLSKENQHLSDAVAAKQCYSRGRQQGITICLHIFHQITKIIRRRRIEGSNTFWRSIFVNRHLRFDKIMKQSRLSEISDVPKNIFDNFSWFSHLTQKLRTIKICNPWRTFFAICDLPYNILVQCLNLCGPIFRISRPIMTFLPTLKLDNISIDDELHTFEFE